MMKKITTLSSGIFILIFLFTSSLCQSQNKDISGAARPEKITTYVKKTYMIPMRDGIKLFTVVLSPQECKRKLPVLMQRTPYNAEYSDMEDSTLNVGSFGWMQSMAEEGYIFVYQDIRGKYKSEGKMQIHLPINSSDSEGHHG